MPPMAFRKSYISIILLHNFNILCFYGQRPVALAALLVKPTEKFQKLQTHIVDVAAQQVQRQIQALPMRAMTTKPTTFPVVAPSILNTCASTAPDSISAIRRT